MAWWSAVAAPGSTWLFGARLQGAGSGALWGAFYGVFWWVLGGLILMPMLLGMPAFAQLKDPMMRPMAWGSLMGHLILGVILGTVTVQLLKRGGAGGSPA